MTPPTRVMRRFTSWHLLILPLLFVAELAVFAPISGVRFDSAEALGRSSRFYATDLITHAAPLIVLVVGMTAVLMTGGIDLSIGSMVALIAAVMATFDPGASFWWTAVPLGLLCGLGLGWFNGFLIARLDVPPIIATLGTLFLFRGLCEVRLGDQEFGTFYDVPGFAWFGGLSGSLLLITLVVALGGGWFFHSRLRRELLMLGGNRVAARYAGIPVFRRTTQVYTAMGGLAFVAAICFTARNGSVSATSFGGLELQVIVAVVLGGTRVEGGNGSIIGSVIGVLMITVLDEGLRSAEMFHADALPFKIQHLKYILMGALLVIGVWVNRPTNNSTG